MGGTRYAVLVGNGAFAGADGIDRLPALRCPAADVGDLRDLLQVASYGGYAVTTLIDRPHNEIRRALYDCLKRAGPDDQVLTYYSGHGKLDEQGNLYLAGSDTDPDSLDPTAFAASDLQKYVAESRAGARIVILDCCFSGAVERIFRHGTTKGDIADQASQALRAQAGQGVFYLTASTDTQTAEEKDQDRHSLLTKHIIEGIGSGAADRDDDGAVRFSELCGFVQDAIRGEAAQRPLSFAFKAYGDPVIALTGRPALAARREAIEQQVYALRGKRLLDGPDAAWILDYIHRPAADAGALEALHAACGDDAVFLRTMHRLPQRPDAPGMARATVPADTAHRLPQLPDAPGTARATVPADTVHRLPQRPDAPGMARVPEAAESVTADPASARPAPAPQADAVPRREPGSAPAGTQPGLTLLARLRGFGLLASLPPYQLFGIASVLAAVCLVLAALWVFRSADQSAALVGTSAPVGNADLAVSDQPANAANQAAPATTYWSPPKLVTGPVPLVHGTTQLLNTKK
jgi:hypothetical protein